MREAAELSLTVPDIRAKAMDEFARTITMMARAEARRSGRDPDDFAVRNVAGAIIGVIMAATLPWSDWTHDHAGEDMFARIDRGLAHLEAGLPL